MAGLVIHAHGGTIEAIGENLVRADAAVTINGLVRWTITRGLGGLEAWAGTPGTVGGALYGNAHWQRANIGDAVESVRVADRDWSPPSADGRPAGVRVRHQPPSAQRGGGAVGGVPGRAGTTSRRIARHGARVLGVPEADAALGLAERRMHLSEPPARA